MTSELLSSLALAFGTERLMEMTYFVTSRCNFRCKHCFAVSTNNQPHPDPQGELSVEEIRHIGRNIKRLHKVSLSGGEPFMREDLGDILCAISKDWKADRINLPTNGTCTENVLKTIRQFGQTAGTRLRILFSLTVPGQGFDAFSGTRDGFATWERTVTLAQNAVSHHRNVSIGVLSTFNADNQDCFIDVMEYVTRELKIDDFSFGLVRNHGDYRPALNLEGFRAFLSRYDGPRSRSSFLTAYRKMIWTAMLDYYAKPRCMGPCRSGKVRIVVSPTGDVYPCEVLGYPQGGHSPIWRMGSLRDHDLDLHQLLASPKALGVSKRIRDSNCHCSDACDLGPTLLRSPGFLRATARAGVGEALSRVFRWGY